MKLPDMTRNLGRSLFTLEIAARNVAAAVSAAAEAAAASAVVAEAAAALSIALTAGGRCMRASARWTKKKSLSHCPWGSRVKPVEREGGLVGCR